MKKQLLLFLMFMLSCSLFAQEKIHGTIIDKDSKEPLVGVYILDPETKTGISSKLDGSFVFDKNASLKTLQLIYSGYKTKEIAITDKTELGNIEMENNVIGLNDVTVTSSVAVSRKTPVAMSTISPLLIETKLGTQEFPELLKSTPGVYATKDGGGYGDSRVNLRGFSSENIAVMINGVPMNDMEWGGVYWSNWAGLNDVTRSTQVQRGLGASKVSAPSVGGSLNIITKSTESKQGGTAYYGIGNDGYNKMAFSVSSGMTKEGLAFTLLGSKTWGDGYAQGTSFVGYAYFANLSYRINSKQTISLTGFGAPQTHYQRKNRLLISEWQKQPDKYRYNAGFGYDMNGNQKSFDYNYYHKPQISLNHFWTINDKSNLSTAVYVSIGNGGGYTGAGTSRTDYYGASAGVPTTKYRKVDGTFDYESLMQANAASENGSVCAIEASINRHIWTGLLSTYTHKLNEHIDLLAGVDMRYYKGIHTAELVDLMGGKFFIDPDRANGKFKNDPNWVNEKLQVGDVVYRDYDGYVMQEGGFAQVEYSKEKLTAFISGSANNNSYRRVDHFYADDVASETINKIGWGAKGGANFNLTKSQNVFANVGYFSRTPYFSGGIFLQSTTSNAINKDAVNEKVFSSEVGYGFRTKDISVNLNIYRTEWNDKTMIKAIDGADPDRGTVNLTGVDALHKGIEVDIKANPLKRLEITAMASVGDWTWNSNAEGYAYNGQGQAVDKTGNVVEAFSPEHAFVRMNLKGIHVGNSAQTTAALGANIELLKGLRIGADYTYYARNYANFAINVNSWGDNSFAQPWQIPDAGCLDMHANYRFKMGDMNASLFMNVNNLLNNEYITDATDGATHDWTTAQVYYAFGINWSTGLKINF